MAAGGPDRVRGPVVIGAAAAVVVVVVVTELLLFGRKCLLAVTRFSHRYRLLLHPFCVYAPELLDPGCVTMERSSHSDKWQRPIRR